MGKKNESPFVTFDDTPGISLYIHFPFCESKCCYCNFNSWKPRCGEVDRWLAAVECELTLRCPEKTPIKTLYIGGGTPNLIPKSGLMRLIKHLENRNDLHALEEFTIEANPSGLTAGFLNTCLEAGVTRISLGIQSFHDEFLKILGRRHNSKNAFASVSTACEFPFSVSLDLMFGLPGQELSHVEKDIQSALAFPVDHISLYGLSVEKDTPLDRSMGSGTLPPIQDELYDSMYNKASFLLQARGFQRYEVSNYAREGKTSRHNQRYWSHAPYLGLGPGAHSFSLACRWSNPLSLDQYEIWTRGGCRTKSGLLERLSWKTLYAEAVWLGLRTVEGIHIGRIKSYYGMQPDESRLAIWVERGFLGRNGDHYFAIDKGWLFLDSLAADLIP